MTAPLSGPSALGFECLQYSSLNARPDAYAQVGHMKRVDDRLHLLKSAIHSCDERLVVRAAEVIGQEVGKEPVE